MDAVFARLREMVRKQSAPLAVRLLLRDVISLLDGWCVDKSVAKTLTATSSFHLRCMFIHTRSVILVVFLYKKCRTSDDAFYNVNHTIL